MATRIPVNVSPSCFIRDSFSTAFGEVLPPWAHILRHCLTLNPSITIRITSFHVFISVRLSYFMSHPTDL